uniref:Uncharacterized protein LOC111112759 n=1 Tax=Crassostrea virginica TaxID=6565 RepID=A0A8B8BTQ0_CRAVI|nr:uncharacterized protein LOC111112759 [Crassostrea virginica]
MHSKYVFCYMWRLLHTTVILSYENIALNKVAWQAHPYGETNFAADRAVDGRTSDLSLWGGECVVSNHGHDSSEWRVDLGNVLGIHHVNILYVTNNDPWDKSNFYATNFMGFSVYISNTTNKEDGILCFKDTNYTIETIPNPVNITCPCNGRYVIYYNNRTHKPYPDDYSMYAYNDICEVEVFGCEMGYYGFGCKKRCPSPCTTENYTCDIVTGVCREVENSNNSN